MSLKKGTLVIFVLFLFCSEVGLYFFTCVLESEFWARFIQPPRVHSFRILSALNKLKSMRKQLFCRFCTLNIIHEESRMGSKFCLCMCFVGNLYSEWVFSRWLDETGSKFWFQNTYEKVKSDFKNRNKTQITKVPFLSDPGVPGVRSMGLVSLTPYDTFCRL